MGAAAGGGLRVRRRGRADLARRPSHDAPGPPPPSRPAPARPPGPLRFEGLEGLEGHRKVFEFEVGLGARKPAERAAAPAAGAAGAPQSEE